MQIPNVQISNVYGNGYALQISVLAHLIHLIIPLIIDLIMKTVIRIKMRLF